MSGPYNKGQRVAGLRSVVLIETPISLVKRHLLLAFGVEALHPPILIRALLDSSSCDISVPFKIN